MTNHRLDRISGWIFAALGIWVIYGAWMMPRFDDRGAAPFEAPGLTPGLLGIFLVICGLILVVRPTRQGGVATTSWDKIAGTPVNRRRTIVALFLTLGYGAGLFGKVPFVPATALFMFLFIVTFEIFLPSSRASDRRKPVWHKLAIAAATAIIFSFATSWIFVEIFLVQLP